MVLDRFDHVISHIRSRDFETEGGKMPFSHTVLPCIRPICEFWWSNHGPVKAAFCKDPFHSSGICDNARKQYPAQEVRWRDYGVLEQKRNRFDDNSSRARLFHRAFQCRSELLQK